MLLRPKTRTTGDTEMMPLLPLALALMRGWFNHSFALHDNESQRVPIITLLLLAVKVVLLYLRANFPPSGGHPTIEWNGMERKGKRGKQQAAAPKRQQSQPTSHCTIGFP